MRHTRLMLDSERGKVDEAYRQVAHIRVAYDVEAVEASPLPDAFLAMLREARKPRRSSSGNGTQRRS